ncbi:MAG: PAS domain S-box protein, partial [Burkholderiales bacterium]
MAATLLVLLVEDSEADALLMVRELTRAGYEPLYERVESAEAMRAALDQHAWDIVLSDYTVPGFGAPAALDLLRARGLDDMPFIIVSGTIGEERAIAALKAGATDYVPKDRLSRLAPAVERALREAAVRRQQRLAEAALRDSQASYVMLVEHAPVGIYRSTPAGRFLTANAALARMLGYDSPADLLRLDIGRDVYLDPLERQRLVEQDAFTDLEYGEIETQWKRKDGTPLVVQLSVRAVRKALGHVEYYEAFVRDLTEQRRLQTQMFLAQRMEAVGRLAAGVAHDFNNLLTVILSYSDLVLDSLPPGDPNREDLEQIRKAGVSASALTRQLLAFSRQQVL